MGQPNPEREPPTMPAQFAKADASACPIWFASTDSWGDLLAQLPPQTRAHAAMLAYEPKPGRHLIVPGPGSAIACVIFGLETAGARGRDPFLPGKLATVLPEGTYAFANAPHDAGLAALGWLLASYRFTRYKPNSTGLPQLVAPGGVDAARLQRIADAMALARDLVNTPANDMGPDALEAAVAGLAKTHGTACRVVRGAELLAQNFPLVHAVGRAATQEPRIADFSWGPEHAPKVTLVGKGVCFDTGGLNIKPDAGMLIMKKDMGGAATALALATMIMGAKLPVRLRVIVPIVENSIAADAFRPGDIYPSRKGLSVEIGNTDAEGRLILADALAWADEDKPELLLDFATLTGAARVALGPDLPPFYTMDGQLAADIARHSAACHDPVWRMPLWDAYDSLLDGKISHLNNISGGPFAGSITAALFLRRFVEHAGAWVHFDIYGWNPSTKPGRPEGGESQAARLLFGLIEERFGAAASAKPLA